MQALYICDPTQLEVLNARLAMRNIPSEPLRPSYDIRPVSTKYEVMGMVSAQMPAMPPAVEYSQFSTQTVFNPGNAQAPWGGFARGIDTESSLRNQFFALQKCPQAAFIPGTTSSLYVSGDPRVTSGPPDTSHQAVPASACVPAYPRSSGRSLTFNASSRLSVG